MPIALIVQLLTTFGPSAVQLISTLISTWESNGIVTAAQWTTLAASLTLTAQDQMKKQLLAAGIDPTSPQGIAMLNLAK